MGRLLHFWKEFQKNWDVYTIISGGTLIGVLTIVLSIIGITNIAVVSSLTLSMLGLLAISIRRDRQSEEQTIRSLLGLSSTLSSITKNKAFEQQCEAYRFLIEIINQHGAKEAVLLQYSGTTCLELVRTLLSKGATVTIYIQHEKTVENIGSHLQVDRIVHTCRNLQGSLAKLYNPKKLKVRKYHAPGTVSGIKIDNRVLCMGWYTYEQINRMNHEDYSEDIVEVSGHDVAAIVVWEGTEEFKALDITFQKMKENYEEYSEEISIKIK